jgi:pimeloyl-ACP methyl ester carboxylesterase
MRSGVGLLPGARRRRTALATLALMTGTLLAATAPASASHEEEIPVVFVHGGAGSGAQYESQAMRWASNGYGGEVDAIDRTSSFSATLNPMLDQFFDNVMERNDADQIHVVGHSLGVALMNNYLNSSPERTARVAKYIGVDSASAGQVPVCPGNPEPVPCMGIYREENQNLFLGDDNVYLHGGHVEMATSAESFAHQYEFFTGHEPKTTDILPEPPGQVTVAGRAIDFPANTGVNGAELEIWQLNERTGARQELKASTTLDATGNWGPVKLSGNHPHEFQLQRPGSNLVGHAYYPPFIRDDHLVRVLASPPGAASLTQTLSGPNHSAAVVIRNNEWWSNHPSGENDTLEVSTKSASQGRHDAGNVLVPGTGNASIGVHLHDRGVPVSDVNATPDGVSSLSVIPAFAAMAFQTGVDVFMPAATPADGTISFVNAPRGDTSKTQVLNVANWASDTHRLGVYMRDYAQDIDSWSECKKAKPNPC